MTTNSKRVIDLNADVGEGDDAIAIATDATIMRAVTSVNIACGVHAGDESTMKRAVDTAMEHGIATGAHVSLDDREGFGRRELPVTALDVYGIVLQQLIALETIIDAADGELTHVKPHGALYHVAARDRTIADAITNAAYDVSLLLTIVGPSGSEILRAADEYSLDFASEVFADRRYARDGTLVARTQPDALITDAELAAKRLITMIDGMLPEDEAPGITVVADTACLHSDTPGAAAFAVTLRMLLDDAGVVVKRRR